MLSAPRDMYGAGMFQLFFNELGMKRVCQILGVTENTIYVWRRGASRIPKAAVLALYWESMYGRSLIDAEHTNELRALFGKIRCLEDELRKRDDIIAGLRGLQLGTANEPFFEELRKHHAYPTGAYEILLQAAHTSREFSPGSEPHASENSDASSEHQLPAVAKAGALPERQKKHAAG